MLFVTKNIPNYVQNYFWLLMSEYKKATTTERDKSVNI